MKEFTFELSDETSALLSERANKIGVTPEELLHSYISELLKLPDDEFKRRIELPLWIHRTMDKYHDVFQRLAES